jgi:hypothetical protein
MSDGGSAGNTPTATGAASRMGSGAGRVYRAWKSLPQERRLAAYAAIGLFISLFLPWYQRQFFAVLGGKLQPASDSQTAWGAFSFVEAAVLLVAAGVLTLLFQRAEGKAFHLPGGDGGVITAAGVWASVLVVWRIFDKQGGNAHGLNATTYGIEWGIFVALAVAILLVYAGSRIRAAHRPEPPLPGEPDAAGAGTAQAARQPAPRQPAAAQPAPGQPAAAQPAAAQPAPGQPAAAQPAPRQPAAAQPAPRQPAAAEPEVKIQRRRPPLTSERPVGWLTARPSEAGRDAPRSEQADPADTSPTEPTRPRPTEPKRPRPTEPKRPRATEPKRPRPEADATLPLEHRDR